MLENTNKLVCVFQNFSFCFTFLQVHVTETETNNHHNLWQWHVNHFELIRCVRNMKPKQIKAVLAWVATEHSFCFSVDPCDVMTIQKFWVTERVSKRKREREGQRVKNWTRKVQGETESKVNTRRRDRLCIQPVLWTSFPFMAVDFPVLIRLNLLSQMKWISIEPMSFKV